jgi:hypothetical protein
MTMSRLVLFLLLSISLFIEGGILATSGEEQTCLAGEDGSCDAAEEKKEEQLKNSTEKQSSHPQMRCENLDETCDYWASLGECSKNAKFMNKSCRRACKLCASQQDVPKDKLLDQFEIAQGADMGAAQVLGDPAVAAHILKSREYMEREAHKEEVADLCKNVHESCTLWATKGECDANPACEYSRI